MQQFRQRILCVDGNPDIREMLTMLLGAAGYETTSVATGQDAARFVARDGFDLFILDKMSRTDAGLELCRELRQRHPHIPIIIYSADARERHHREAVEAGATVCVDKPHIEPLVSAVQKLIKESAPNGELKKVPVKERCDREGTPTCRFEIKPPPAKKVSARR
jgi:CheY-like chemotaxis protein